MNIFVIRVALSIVSLVAALSYAENAAFVDLRDNAFTGKVVKIRTPTQVDVLIKRDGYSKREILRIRLADIMPANGADPMANCTIHHEIGHARIHHPQHVLMRTREPENIDPKVLAACKILRRKLLHKRLGLEVTHWDRPTFGYLTQGDSVVNFDLVAKGLYRVDYAQSRAAHLVLTEKKARCERVGEWQRFLDNRIEDMKCQE